MEVRKVQEIGKGKHGNHARGAANGKWKGGIALDHEYKRIQNKTHHRSIKGYVLEHILIAEKALGRPLPEKAIIHHTDVNKGKIDPRAIVICEDQAYHMLLHRRMRARRECGHVDWRKCCYCHKYDDPKNLIYRQNGGRVCHQECEREYQRRRKATRTAA